MRCGSNATRFTTAGNASCFKGFSDFGHIKKQCVAERGIASTYALRRAESQVLQGKTVGCAMRRGNILRKNAENTLKI